MNIKVIRNTSFLESKNLSQKEDFVSFWKVILTKSVSWIWEISLKFSVVTMKGVTDISLLQEISSSMSDFGDLLFFTSSFNKLTKIIL